MAKAKIKETPPDVKPDLGGRPRTIINYEVLEELCKVGSTGAECAVILRVSYLTLNKRLLEDYNEALEAAGGDPEKVPFHLAPGFLEYSDKFKAAGRISLRRAQMKNAIKNENTQMQIWLGKQMLDQKDRHDYSSEDGSMSPVKAIADMTLEELRKEARARGLPETIFDN